MDGSKFDVTAVELRGESVALPVTQRRALKARITGHAYAINDDGSGWTALHPLLVAEPGREPGVWRSLFSMALHGNDSDPRDPEI